MFVCLALYSLYSFANLVLGNKSEWIYSKLRDVYSCCSSGIAFLYDLEKAIIVTLKSLILVCDYILITI